MVYVGLITELKSRNLIFCQHSRNLVTYEITSYELCHSHDSIVIPTLENRYEKGDFWAAVF